MKRERDWCEGCKEYHHDGEIDSGWRIVPGLSDVRDMGWASADTEARLAPSMEDVEEDLARQWRVPSVALGRPDWEKVV